MSEPTLRNRIPLTGEQEKKLHDWAYEALTWAFDHKRLDKVAFEQLAEHLVDDVLGEAEAALRAAGGQPPSDGPDELEQIRKIVLAICDEPEDDAPYVIVGENGTPIVEADTLPEAIEQIIACWNAVGQRLDRVGPSDGMPSEPSERAIIRASAVPPNQEG
jgi:hypothetical protein